MIAKILIAKGPIMTERNQEHNAHLKQLVDEALELLTERERCVVELRCGYRGKPVTQINVAAEFNVSRTRIIQIENNAWRKMRSFYLLRRLEPFFCDVVRDENRNGFYYRFLTKLFHFRGIPINADPPTGETWEPHLKNSKEELTPDSSIESLELSIRSFDCLMRAGIHTVQELLDLPYEKLCKIKNLNEKSLAEINEKRKTIVF